MSVQVIDYPKARLYMEVETEVEANLRINCCVKEPWTVDFIERMPPGAVLWDVGANIGGYTIIAAALGHPCVAIEPFHENVGGLAHNLTLNHLRSAVYILSGVAGPSHGWTVLNVGDSRRGGAQHTVGKTKDRVMHQGPVISYPLDGLLKFIGLPGPHYLKIDVDGQEELVMAGAMTFLKECAGVIMETPLAYEPTVHDIMAGAGLTLKGRWDTREGHSIGPIAYVEFGRG